MPLDAAADCIDYNFRHTHRQTDKNDVHTPQTYTQTDILTDRQTYIHGRTHTTDIHTHKQTHNTDIQTNKQTYILQTYTQTDIHTTDIHTNRRTHKLTHTKHYLIPDP